MFEVDEAARIISGTAAADANVIFGAVVKNGLSDQVRITVIATGFDENVSRVAQLVRPVEPSMHGVVNNPASAKQQDTSNQMNQNTNENEEDKPEAVGGEKKKDEFGEDFDIPAFLRKIH